MSTATSDAAPRRRDRRPHSAPVAQTAIQLNAEEEDGWPHLKGLLWSIAAMAGLIALGLNSLGWIPCLAFWYFLIQWILVKQRNGKLHSARKNALSTMPKIEGRAFPSPEAFDPATLPTAPDDPPELQDGITKLQENERAMLAYLEVLKSHHEACTTVMAAANARYRDDRQHLERQQFEVFRLSALAERPLRLLDSRIPPAAKDFRDVPTVTIPPPVPAKTITVGEQYTKVMDRLKNGGIAGAGGDIRLIALQLAARAALMYREYQKLLRGFADAKGALALYHDQVGQQLAVLGRGHTELVNVSEQLANISHEMRGLMAHAEAMTSSQGTLTAEEGAKVQRLKSLALVTAKLQAGRNV